MGMLDWLFKRRKRKQHGKQDCVIFYATAPDSLYEKTMDFTQALKNLPVLREEAL